MNNHRIELRIGIVVITATICLIYLAIQFGKDSLFNFGSEYKIIARFDSAPGLVLGTPIFKNGVKIGRVGSVQLVDDDREVEVLLLIQIDRKLYTNEECVIKTPPIMGTTTVEFSRKKGYVGDIEPITEGGPPIRGAVPGDLFNSVTEIEQQMTVAINNVSLAASNLADLMGRLNIFVGTPEEIAEKQQRLDDTIAEARRTMASFCSLSDNINDIVSDPEINASIRNTTCQFPETVKESRALIAESQRFLTDLHGTSAKINEMVGKIDRQIDAAEPFVQSVGADGPRITASLRQSAEKLNGFFDELTTLVQAVNNADGSIKKLLNDSTLYDNIQQTVLNAEQLTAELRPAVAEIRPLIRDTKPVIDNAKVFTDKLARNPSEIISGVFRKKPPIKGSLPQWGDGLGSDGICETDLAVLRAGSPPICTVGNLAGRYSSPETYSTYPSYSAENVEAAEAYGANYGGDVSGSAHYAAYSMPVKETKSNCFSFLWPFGKKSRKATTHSPDCPYHHVRIDAGNGTYSDRYDGTLVEMTNEMEADYVDSDIEPAPLNPTLRESPPFPVLSGEKEIMGEIPLDLNGPILETPIGTPQLAPIPDFSHTPNHARRDMAVETRQEKHESPLTAPNSQSTSSPQISRSSRTPQLVFTPETTVR